MTLQDQGKAMEALRHFRGIGRSLVKRGGDAAPLLETARRLCLLYDYVPALELLTAAAKNAGYPAFLLIKIALGLRQEGLFNEAAGFARLALRRDAAGPQAVDARLLLAECAERRGQLDECLEWTREVCQTHPGSIPAQRLRAAVLRRAGRLEDALTCLNPLLAKGGPAHWETCRAWFELGHIMDERGDYAGAWQAWTQARRCHSPAADWKLYQQQADHVWKHVALVHESLSHEQLTRWTRQPDACSANTTQTAILTGHPRSGTTLLEQALDAHSGIISAEETTVFTSAVYRPLFQHGPPGQNPAQRLDEQTPEELRHWSTEYHGLTRLALRSEPGSRIVLDKNPDLLQLVPAALRLLPGVRIIVMLRDPRDILVSMFALALPPNHTAWSYRNVSEAAKMIALRLGLWQRIRGIIPPAVFHEVRYEHATTDFSRAVEGTLDFLGCPHEAATLDPASHSKRKIVQSPTYAAVREPIHSRATGRWRNYEPWISPALALLHPAIAGLGYAKD